jgi:hypothetical protein
MILISHRGNIDGVDQEKENLPSYIESAIQKNFFVEIDLRIVQDKLFLGHDIPQYEINDKWLLKNNSKIFIHCKNILALKHCITLNLTSFYHVNEKHVPIINYNLSNLIWSHDLTEATDISVIPLINKDEILNYQKYNVFGVCSDYIGYIK